MKTIESERLRLRSWKETDAAQLWELKQASRADFLYYLDLHSVADCADIIKVWADYQNLFPVSLKESGGLIGVAGLCDVDRYKGYCELETWLGDAYDNMAYRTELWRLLLDESFMNEGLLLAFITCKENDVAAQTAAKLGFVYEGMLRKFARESKADVQRYSLTLEDFRK